ncbi:DUF1764-domain-containing protein [Meira miltonrushii]|uniref:DUF1764-domain-containing protein n=1 Tax=Meira miltonrushii TaxID=1280837 RepID=A0A316V5J7_9BASI|nr:DUF1764-domain-containing protein [Meira miltonrushii]PWN32298.1 DUF1764-domain-containing protein [Meira miltonrushii]
MAKSEIDDIFAGSSSKGKSDVTKPNGKKLQEVGKKSEKKDKSDLTKPNGKNLDESGKKSVKKSGKVADAQPNTKSKRKAPETVVDPSKALETAASTSAKKQKKGKSSTSGISAEDEEFRDSRGTTRRKTEDGFSIYSEKELKLDQGGDTNACPFDCDCCF